MAAIVSPSTSTSAAIPPVGFTRVPPVMSVRAIECSLLLLHEPVVLLGPAIPVELPPVADLGEEVHVEVAHHELGLMAVGGFADELSLGVHEVRSAVEVVGPEALDAAAVYGADEVLVRDGRRRLLELPEVGGQPSVGRRRVEDDLGPVETEGAPALGEVAVVADVDTDLADGGVEDGKAEVAGAEVELLPEALYLRDVVFAVLAEVAPIGVDEGRGVVEHAGLLLFVHRQYEDHPELGGEPLEALRGGPRDRLGVLVVRGVLDLAEVRAIEQLLEADDLGALSRRLAGVLLVGLDHRLLVTRPRRLDERRTHGAGHVATSSIDLPWHGRRGDRARQWRPGRVGRPASSFTNAGSWAHSRVVKCPRRPAFFGVP